MHIVFTRRNDPFHQPDGINVFILALADRLLARGHSVTLVSAVTTDLLLMRQRYPIGHWPDVVSLTRSSRLRDSEAAMKWATAGRRVIRELVPDLTIVNGAVPTRVPGLAVFVAHDLEARGSTATSPLRTLYKRFTYAYADRVVATCSEIRDWLTTELRRTTEPITVIPTCVPSGARPLAIDQREMVVVHMGTATYKNVSSTIRAFENLTVDARLVITGPQTDALRRQIEALPMRIQDRIQIPGILSSEALGNLIGSARVIAVPSVYRCPVASPTVLDSFAAGTPVVCSPSISRDLTGAGSGAITVDPADTPATARALEIALMDDEWWTMASQAAVTRAAAYQPDRVADAYLALNS